MAIALVVPNEFFWVEDDYSDPNYVSPDAYLIDEIKAWLAAREIEYQTSYIIFSDAYEHVVNGTISFEDDAAAIEFKLTWL